MTETDSRYEEGDVVATDRARGVVTAVLAEDFEFPLGEDEETAVSASDDSPAYVVGLASTKGGDAGAGVYRASDLESSSFEDDAPETTDAEGPETEVVSSDVDALEDLPEGWDRQSVLEYWSSIGGSWDSCVDDLTDEWTEDRAEQLCSAMKDEVLQTQRWRNRF